MKLGQWNGFNIKMDPGVLSMIQPDAYVYRNYYQGQTVVNLYIGWYETMEKSDLAHSPLVCYQGQGWAIRDRRDRHVQLADQSTFDTQRMIIEKEGQKDLVLYWYQAKGYSTGQLGKMRFRLLRNKLLGRSSTNCFVRVSTTMSKGKTNEDKVLDRFIRDSYPKINAFFQK